MSFLEFDAIQKYFSKITNVSKYTDVTLSIGDDAAIVTLPENKELVICTDTLNIGIHFPPETSAYNIGYKALAVNLSDIAAMGASPKWFTLNISLPELNESWVKDFSQGLADLSKHYDLVLIGGDTTRGPLSISITLAGHINKGCALTRSKATLGDKLYLSGCTGEAAFGLACLSDDETDLVATEYFITRLNQPTARVELGKNLMGVASACIDISDGLLADAKHIAAQSKCGLRINLNDVPLPNINDTKQAETLALSGGDDYELLFTVANENQDKLETLTKRFKSDFSITCIGEVIKGEDVQLFDKNNKRVSMQSSGYEHFSE